MNDPVPHFFTLHTYAYLAFPAGSDSKESACNRGDPSLIPESGRCPGEGHGNLLQYSCLESSHGQRSLVGHSLWNRKESDVTELTLSHFGTHPASLLCLSPSGTPHSSLLPYLLPTDWKLPDTRNFGTLVLTAIFPGP